MTIRPRRRDLTRWARLCAAAGLLLAFFAAGVPARAAEAASDWFVTEQGRVRLIAAKPSLQGDQTVELGLEFLLAPHWKVYWRSPGDAGYPPHLDWTGSENLGDAVIAWPAPMRFSLFGLDTMGYENAVVLPIRARLARPGAPLHLEAALQYLTCEKICIPYETTLRLDLPAGAGPPGIRGFADRIAAYQARVPGDGAKAGLSLESAVLETGAKPVLALRFSADPPLAHPDAFVEGAPSIAFGPPDLVTDEPHHPVLRLPVLAAPADLAMLAGHRLTLTVVDGARAIETTAIPAEAAPVDALGRLLPMILAALLGGLILNVMPCVLPVLSIKLLGLVENAGAGRAFARRAFLATASGILLSFLALALAMIALRSAGLAVGWGLQFQQPIFLIGMVWLLTLFAANLWGWFEIALPAALLDRLGGPSRPGSISGNVAAGALATLLATPCSAPFLGTAVGFALAGSRLDILIIFLALGFGLAAPYLAVAAVPSIARLLPRPGRWMIRLRGLLGFALIGTALWLIFVLEAQISTVAALAVAAVMAVLLLSLATLRAPLRPVASVAVIAAALIVPLVAPVAESPSALGRSAVPDAGWQPFDRGRIASLVGEGKVVFVDVTADWCLTCQANKRLVLDRAPVRAGLAAAGVVAMQADWTRPDPEIADYLRSYGRYGIPFNAVYGPGAPSGIALSELLSSAEVLAALDRARGAAPGSASRAAGTIPERGSESPAHGG